MSSNYTVVFTPGAFGNFLSYLLDCYQTKEILPSPFESTGASHARTGSTLCSNLVSPAGKKQLSEIDPSVKRIGIVWQPDYFNYILHAYLSRANSGEYKGCGVEFLEKNFYEFIQIHPNINSVKQHIDLLKHFFNYTVDENNPTVPRHILRQFFWLQIFYSADHIVTKVNDQIKNMQNIELIDIADILEYGKLKSFLNKLFGYDLDFSAVHTKFLTLNTSLKDFLQYKHIVKSCQNKQLIPINNLSVIGEASVLYDLEKYYFDVPFFTIKDFFKDTKEILDYVKHFPPVMKQPNKLYHQHYKRFPPNVVL